MHLFGGYDKTDLIIYISKILTVLKKKVLFVDTTITSKSKYIVPTMTPTKKYVTTFDGIDIAIGFENMQTLKDYMAVTKDFNYDFMFFDIDDPQYYANFELNPYDLHFFVTSFDVYSVQRGVNVLREIKQKTDIVKVLFTKNPNSEESEYLDFITFNYQIKWKADTIYFPFDTEDLYEIYKNQRFSRVRLAGLSMDYIDSLSFLTENISGISRGEIKRAMKAIERLY